MRTLIVFPRVGYCTGYRPHLERDPRNGATYHVAQALPYLYSIARAFSEETLVLDFNFRSFEENLARIDNFKPDVMLVSSTVNSYDSTRQIVETVHRRRPETRAYVGGPSVTANYLARPGILSIDAPCEFVITDRDIFGWTEQVYGLRSNFIFPTFQPSYDFMFDTYPEEVRKSVRHTVSTSLGCTFTCHFCLNHSEYGLSYKQPDVLRAELLDLRDRHGATRVSVSDPYFFMKFKHADLVMDIFKELELDWAMQTTLISLTDENLDKLAASRCKSFLIGIEHFASAEIDKPVNSEAFEHVLRRTQELGMQLKPSFIVGLLDIDFAADVQQIEYIENIIESTGLTSNNMQVNLYTPYIPDTRDRLMNVPFKYWGVMPVTAQSRARWDEFMELGEMVYKRIYTESAPLFDKVKEEFLELVDWSKDDLWWSPESGKPYGRVPAEAMTA